MSKTQMSVKSAFISSAPVIEPYVNRNGIAEDGVFKYVEKSTIYGIIDWDGILYTYECDILPGYVTNYASVPKILQWFLPSYVIDDPVYNAFAAIHDWLYSVNGDIGDFRLTRSCCDDIFRSGIRESNTIKSKRFPRFVAGCADLGVGLFAWGSSHWGNDTYNCKSFCSFKLTEIP